MQLVVVDRVEPDADPVEAELGLSWQEELVRLGRHQRIAFLLREGEAHERLVARERNIDDLSYAEPQLVSHHRFVGAGQV
jgi:hypothetical protein